MSCSYADGLSPYENKGKLGLKEVFESKESVAEKVKILAKWISSSSCVVVHTGAGISTTAGIPDFRGPKGVWTLEEQGKKPEINISFNDAVPTTTHMGLLKLLETGKISYIISQNIDGLHLRSGVPRDKISELHGNMFVEQCNSCRRQFVRKSATTSVGQKCLGITCPSTKTNGRPCRGILHDFVLDWEHALPEKDLDLAHYFSNLSDLSICLGTTLQIIPSGNLPLYTKKNTNGKVVICNLQPTKYDKKADMIINTYVDDVMSQLLEELEMKLDPFNPDKDPTKMRGVIDWTINESNVRALKKLYENQLKVRRFTDERSYGNNKSKRRRKSIKREIIDCFMVEEKDRTVKEEPNNKVICRSVLQNLIDQISAKDVINGNADMATDKQVKIEAE